MRFLANYVQSDDFCFFSSRKRRKNICFSLSFHKAHYVCASFHQGKEENKILPLLFLCLFMNHTMCVFSSRKRRNNICLIFVFPVFIPPRHSQQTRDRLPGSIPAIISLKTGRQEYSIDGGESGSRREA